MSRMPLEGTRALIRAGPFNVFSIKWFLDLVANDRIRHLRTNSKGISPNLTEVESINLKPGKNKLIGCYEYVKINLMGVNFQGESAL